MPKVSISHRSSATAQHSLVTIKKFFETDQDLQRFDANLKCEFNESSLSGKVIGKQFKADVSVKALDSGSQIDVTIDLPLILSPFKGKVEEILKRKLTKHLA